MKLLYDISLLGIGHFDTKARSGIFRVIENLAKELVEMPECEISFCSLFNLKILFQALDYYKTVPEFADIPFTRLNNSFMRKKWHQYQMEVLNEKLRSGTIISPLTKLLTKAKWQQARVLQKISPYGNRQTFPLAAVNDADIYHTPFFSVPPTVQKSKVKKYFITCYDLIPIIKPEFCDEGTVKQMVDFFETVTPETWILCISQSARNDLLNYMGNRVDPSKAIVTPLAASSQFYQSTNKAENERMRKRYGIPEGPFILSLGTLEPRKNLNRLILAFEQLIQQQHLPDLHLILVGNKGLQWDQLVNSIRDKDDIRKRIIITGYVADKDLAALYTEATMFVYPSLYEGFGLPPLEAMKCGTPVITSNTTSLPEVVGDAGIMIAPEDTDALCQAMLTLYSQPVLRREFSSKSIVRAEQFSWRRCAEETVAAYKTSLQF